jgi:hypothetical protein
MAEVTQYTFELKDLATDLVKLHGIREGKWLIGFEFSLGAGIVGPTVETQRPGAIVVINKLTLTRHSEGMPESSFIVDAAEVNPKVE